MSGWVKSESQSLNSLSGADFHALPESYSAACTLDLPDQTEGAGRISCVLTAA